MSKMQSYSRREFLRKTGTAIAGAALVPDLISVRQADAVPKNKKVRIGVVGGNFGSGFYWHEHPNCVVEAVSDLRPERLQRLKDAYKCDKGYPSLEELITDKDIDAVAVFTGAPDHAKHSIACLTAGKHVQSAVPAGMTLEECEELLDVVKSTGLKYMMCETSYYHQSVISARKWYQEGRFGEIFFTEAEYFHPGLEILYFENGKRTWRHGMPAMNYPTHATSYLVGVTKERLTEVTCIGWGDGDPILKDNRYNNPFWNATAMFKTDKGHALRVAIWRRVPAHGCERGQWYGQKMSFFDAHPNGVGPVIARNLDATEKDDAGFTRQQTKIEPYDQPEWWKTDMLPEPLRHPSGHDGSHTFLTHEFIDAIVKDRQPAIDIYEALAFTVPGIIAHQSALQGGKQMKVPVFG